MKKHLAIIFLLLTVATAFATDTKKNGKSEEGSNFNGVITYIGKVTRIPDRSKTTVKLNEFDSFFDMYFGDEYTKRVENINNQIIVSYVNGIKEDVFFQTIESQIDKSVIYITANPDEQRKFQLTPQTMRSNHKKVTYASGKKTVCGRKCKKVVCNMVTEDNIHLQLIAWYDPNIRLKDLYTPFFGKIDGMPLMYDFYNGEYVVTYTATKIRKTMIPNSTFDRPDATPISMTEYVMGQ